MVECWNCHKFIPLFRYQGNDQKCPCCGEIVDIYGHDEE